MPAFASLEELKAVEKEIQQFKSTYPEAASGLMELLRKNRKVGHKNICKMILGEATAEELKI